MENVELSLETQFEIANFDRTVDNINDISQLRDLLKYVHKSMVTRQKLFQSMLHQAYFGGLTPSVPNPRPTEE